MPRAVPRDLPKEFLDWQVQLRLHTMVERAGAPHIGVVPLVNVARPGTATGVMSHSIVCGLLPRRDLLESKTREFRALYEAHVDAGAKQLYDAGIRYLLDYYTSSDGFDGQSITTLAPSDSPLVDALRARGDCSLVFNVFDPKGDRRLDAPRCSQFDCTAELLRTGPVFENVWWHNTLFHGKADDVVVVHFRHVRGWDTRFGGVRSLAA